MDYYNRLGVSQTASPEEIKKAYKKLAMQHHPDRPDGNKILFQQINEAYDTLKDPVKRQEYDNPIPKQKFNYNSQNVNDIFDNLFRNGRRIRKNSDIAITLKIKLEDVATGRDIVGRYTLNNGQEELATLRVPKGIESGSTMRVQGLGDNTIASLPRGDLYVQIIVENHSRFIRDRSHLKTKCSINVLELILGTEIVIEKLGGGPLSVKIPPGTNPGTILSIAGYGLPESNTNRVGNLYLEIKGVTPKIEDEEIFKKVKEIYDGISTSARR